MNQTTILIVDDDFISRKTLELLLQPTGFRLAVATNGKEALEQAHALIPDLVLLDVVMPDMDGYAVCRALRDSPTLAEVPILLVTALDDRESRLRGLEAGADDFISKPCDAVELRARVQAITRLNRYRRLQAQRARFEWVVEVADDGYLLIDSEDTISYANPQARRCLGLPTDHRPIEAGFIEQVGRQYRCEPAAAWDGWPSNLQGTTPRYLVRAESSTARELWLQVDLLALPGTQPDGQLVRLRNVTEQLSLQRDIWKFHSTIFHKLRTPLVSVIGGMEALTLRGAALTGAEAARIAAISLEAAQRLHSDIEDVLQYLSAPTAAYRGAGVRMHQLASVASDLAERLGLSHVQVAIDEAVKPAQLTLTRRALDLVLLELLENARKFHPRHAPNVSISATLAGSDQVTIQVADDGIHLTPEQTAQAWLPYYQGEKYQTGQTSGMGLGLPMVAAMIHGIGGSTRLYNRGSGPGVVVEVCVPARIHG